jgi:FkbM family methyltransferase
MTIKTAISALAIKTIACGFRPPHSKRIAAFDQLAKTITLLKRLEINVFLDVGANRGFYAKHVRDAGYKDHLFSFEPIASDCEQIERFSSGDEKWKIFNYALGAENGTKQFNIVQTGGHTVLSSFLPIKGDIDGNSVPVTIRRLDDVLPPLLKAIERPRIFLKMDTQGFDGHVIEGATGCLNLIFGLQSEISVVPLYDGMRSYTESLADYHRLGFGLVDLFVVNRMSEGLILEYDCLMQRS